MNNRLGQIMSQKGISQKALAIEIGRPANTVNGYVKGNRQPDWQTTIDIADALGTSVDYLIGATDIPPEEAEAEMLRNLHFKSAQFGQEEQEILKRLNALNLEGVERLMEYADFLRQSERYRKKPGTASPGE